MSDGKYAPRPGHIPGAVVNLGGVELVLAPLNLDGVQAAKPMQDELTSMQEPADIVRVSARLLHLSLERNYPDITIDEVAALLDMHNVQMAMDAMVTQSGYRRATPGELKPAS